MRFSKMHGLGNDFMILENINQKFTLSPKLINKMSDRHLGVGFDQLLVVEPSYKPEIDFNYRIFNPNGSEVFQCGNGARCFALFVRLKGLTDKNRIQISTKTTTMILKIIHDNMVRVDMNEPIFDLDQIPFKIDESKKFFMKIAGEYFKFGLVSIGNPHCVIPIKNITTTKINVLGPIIEKHHYFPESINVNFMEVVNSEHIRLRVYERGAGETYACGSGACASVAYGIKQGILKAPQIRVDLPGGTLYVSWNGKGQSIYMTGPATHVFDGQIYIT
ncbi:diaminopimelate epimerase [Candidatus Pantoea edessiphila]|uniref:diaminopimelate epimerase n=1 Tax=Candidatus Pantoea edessiphila TaxID=2044610 RepID=UPI0018F5EE5F|nr:diaminopimelate epimerase [Candidatus Pantoea edessiphila]